MKLHDGLAARQLSGACKHRLSCRGVKNKVAVKCINGWHLYRLLTDASVLVFENAFTIIALISDRKRSLRVSDAYQSPTTN